MLAGGRSATRGHTAHNDQGYDHQGKDDPRDHAGSVPCHPRVAHTATRPRTSGDIRAHWAQPNVSVLESTIIVAGIVSVLSVVTLRQDLPGTGADAGTLTVAGRTLVAFHDWTFLLGPGFCAGIGNGLLLGYLMYTSGLVPRRMALLGLVGGSLAFVAATGALFDVYDRQSAPQFLLTLPEIVWEASLAIWLVVKGFKPSPILSATGDRRIEAGPVAPVG
jgi:hypothetical protein